MTGNNYLPEETLYLLTCVRKYTALGCGRVKSWDLVADDVNKKFHGGEPVRTGSAVKHRFYRMAEDKQMSPTEYLKILSAGHKDEVINMDDEYKAIKEGWLFKSEDQLVKETGMAPRKIQSIVTQLKKAGLLPDKHKKTVLKELGDVVDATKLQINDDISQQVLIFLRKSVLTVKELSEKIDRSESTVHNILDELRNKGYDVEFSKDKDQVLLDKHIEDQTFDPLDINIFKSKSIKFGLVSDTHFGSKYQQVTLLKTAYDIMDGEGVEFAIHCGDITDGYKVYGERHIRELFIHDADAQRDYAIEHYPRKSFKTYITGGNHDGSFKKTAGYNIVRGICNEREDLIYRGMLSSQYLIKEQVFNVMHPSGGLSYARSYRPQKLAEDIMQHAVEFARSTKDVSKLPSVLAIGHYHVEVNFYYMGMRVFAVPCFQDQTPYLKTKGLTPIVGFIVCEVTFDEEGDITKIVPDIWVMNSQIKKKDW